MLPTPIELWLTFITALLASGHCIGMCGGMVAALSLKTTQESLSRSSWIALATTHLFYGVGRLLTYVVLGGLSGWMGSMVMLGDRAPWLKGLPLFLAGIAMIFMGLETWGVRWFSFSFFSWMEGMGKGGSRLHATPLILGVITGVLPCGLHWAFQAKAFATGSIPGGMMLLVAFGLGTLPAMLGLGWLASLLNRETWTRLQRGAGLLVMVMGLNTLRMGVMKMGFSF